MSSQTVDLIIVGAGPSGMTAALYAVRAGHKVQLFEQLAAGGQAALTSHIDNYPGFPEGVDGFELTAKMQEQVVRFGVEFVYDAVSAVSHADNIWTVTTVSGGTYTAKSVLIASGASARRTGAKGEDKFFGKGIGTCAICDGAFYKDKVVAVIGGGNSALDESVYLSKIVKKVYIVHRRDQFRADKIVQDAFNKLSNVEYVLDSVVEEFKGSDKLDGINVKNVKTGEFQDIALDGVFLYVGLTPNTAFLDASFKNEAGFVVINPDGSIKGAPKGLFASGDCCEGATRQVVSAAGKGAEVSYSIGSYLEHL
ncbi:MAG: NAD(P)/FAD-dependent oxidoreductase [Brevinema sp.]